MCYIDFMFFERSILIANKSCLKLTLQEENEIIDDREGDEDEQNKKEDH